MRILSYVLVAIGVAVIAREPSHARENELTAQSAFERLKGFEGRWEGNVTSPDGPGVAVEYRLTAGGHTVVETMFPGTDHEMMTLYHLDGDQLLGKHYCSSGNQPEFLFDPERSSDERLHFAFIGGTNLDPASDAHMHGGTIHLEGEGGLRNIWDFHVEGKKVDENRFYLQRSP